jgi:hypothetical protein
MRAETVVVREELDVNRRLAELSMSKVAILAVRDAACSMGATGSSPFFPSNGAGQLAYQYGTREMRAQLDSLGWEIDQSFGTQGVRLIGKKTIVLYQNVDVACSIPHTPNPRSRKGAGSERLSQRSAFEVIEDQVPTTYTMESSDGCVWYIMVAENGAVEVTNAVVHNGRFADLVERIFVSDGSDMDIARRIDDKNGDDAVDFEVVVTRR